MHKDIIKFLPFFISNEMSHCYYKQNMQELPQVPVAQYNAHIYHMTVLTLISTQEFFCQL